MEEEGLSFLHRASDLLIKFANLTLRFAEIWRVFGLVEGKREELELVKGDSFLGFSDR